MLQAKIVSAREWFGVAVVEYHLSLDDHGQSSLRFCHVIIVNRHINIVA